MAIKELTEAPLAPDVVMIEIQFFPEGFNNPLDNSSLKKSLLNSSLSLLIIFLSKSVKADSPFLRIFFSIFSCNKSVSAKRSRRQIPIMTSNLSTMLQEKNIIEYKT